MLQNEGFQHVYHRISSPWLKKIFDFDDLKSSRTKDFNMFITEYLHHDWRNFLFSMIWNTPEWRISMKDLDHIKWYVDSHPFQIENNTLIRRMLPNILAPSLVLYMNMIHSHISFFLRNVMYLLNDKNLFLVRKKGAFWKILIFRSQSAPVSR